MDLQEREKKKDARELAPFLSGKVQKAQDLERMTPSEQGLLGRGETAQQEGGCALAAPIPRPSRVLGADP